MNKKGYSSRQQLYTIHTCEALEKTIRGKFPLIKELMVYLDEEDGEKVITVKFDYINSPYMKEDIQTFIDTLPRFAQ